MLRIVYNTREDSLRYACDKLQDVYKMETLEEEGGELAVGGVSALTGVAGSKVCTNLPGSVSSHRELALDLLEI